MTHIRTKSNEVDSRKYLACRSNQFHKKKVTVDKCSLDAINVSLPIKQRSAMKDPQWSSLL